MARQEMLDIYGMAAYNDGFHVYTTISSSLQQLAQKAVIDGLLTYDSRHGFRGPERQLPPADPESDTLPLELWQDALAEMPVIAGLTPAIISAVAEHIKPMFFWRDE